MAPQPLTPAEQAFYPTLFAKLAQNNLISGSAAYAFLTLSALPPATLGEIWAVADPNDRGSLDVAGWTVAMRLIASVQAGGAVTAETGEKAPAQLPRFKGHPPPPAPRSSFSAAPAAPAAAPSPSRSPFGAAFSPPPAQQQQQQQAPAQAPWDVTPAEKQASDRFFDQLDKFGRGVIDGDVAVPFMLESKLPEVVLASIWDLADIRKEGNLTRDEFAVAMHLIKKKIAGRELPAELPLSLIPPSLRPAQQAAPPAPQPSLFDAFGDSPPASANAATNYFAASPTGPQGPSAASGFGMAPFAPAPESNLMGDDDPFVPASAAPLQPQPTSQSAFGQTPVLSPQATGTFRALSPQGTGSFAQRGGSTLSPQPTGSSFRAPPPASSAPRSPAPPAAIPPQLTALRTEHASLASSVADLQSAGASLEPCTIDAGKEIMDLQAKLISLRSTHESEQGNVDRLKARAAEQASERSAVQAELISAESAVSALRAEKDDLDGQVMRDREDVREMKRRLGELTAETNAVRDAVDKVKKEARQQRGLATIAKKQLATAEGAREALREEAAKAERELKEAEREAIEAKEAVERTEREHAESAAAAKAISPPASSPASPSSGFAAIPAAIASIVPAAIVPATLSPDENAGAEDTTQTAPPSLELSASDAPAPTASDEPEAKDEEQNHSTVAGIATAAAAAVVAGAGAVAAGATEIFSGNDENEQQDGAHPAEASTPIGESEVEPAPAVVPLDETADEGVDSSDDEAEGPEDLDGQPSYISRQVPAACEDEVAEAGGESLSRQASSHLASTASAFGSFESTGAGAPPAAAAAAAVEADPFGSDDADTFAPAPTAIPLPVSPAGSEPPQSIASAFPPVEQVARQPTTTAFDDSFGADDDDDANAFNTFDGDFQPVAITPATGSSAANNNPFFSSAPAVEETKDLTADAPAADAAAAFEATPTPPATSPLPPAPPAPPAAAASAPPPIPSRPDQAQPPAHAGFDDAFGSDDFDTFDTDFEPVSVSPAAAAAGTSTNNPFAAGGPAAKDAPVYDFDPSFADFDTAFDDARPAGAGQATAPAAAGAFSVDDAFGSSPFAPAAAGNSTGDHSHATTTGQHAFDDAFGDAPSPQPDQQQAQFAPPPGPPPGQQAERPSLPSRPTEPTGAEADDIPDVKKIVAMGFSRSQALNALEIGDYNLQKAIDHLVSGA